MTVARSVSLILTVKNEAAALPRLLESVLAQTCPPQEVVVADGGSTDETRRVLATFSARLPLVVLECPGANISQGRNAAIARARGEVIAATDAGVRLDRSWLEELLRPFDDPASCPEVVSGFFLPDPQTTFETALAATTLPALRDIRPDRFLPSSRSVAFSKRAWEKVGGYPEWLDYCEDLLFDLGLRSAGLRFAFAPGARVLFQPRASLGAFFRQYYLYARGDGKADLFLKRHLARYFTYLLVLPLSVLLLFVQPWAALLLWAAGCLIMFLTPYRRLAEMYKPAGFSFWRAIAWVPVIRITGDLAKMIGYPVGVRWRMTNSKS